MKFSAVQPAPQTPKSLAPVALERRVLLDAAAVATGLDAIDEQQDEQPLDSAEVSPRDDSAALLDALAMAAPAATERREVAFVDARVRDQQVLRDGLDDAIEVHVLDLHTDGLAQIAAVLDGRDDVDAVHIFSHGADNQIVLGSTALDAGSLGEHEATLADIGEHLSESGDLLFYGCNVAASADGEALIEGLALATGADVAASADLTGGAQAGGDWDLEFRVGNVEPSSVDADDLVLFAETLDGVPSVSVTAPADPLIGEDFDFSVTFDNTSATDSGFGPFVEVYVHAAGADGVYDPATDSFTSAADGITVNSASFLGGNLTIEPLTLEDADPGTAGLQFEHPFAVDVAGDPVVVTAPAGYAEGDTVLLIKLPFGSFAPGQPPATINFNASLSNFADVGTALDLTARGGFEFGNTAVAETGDPTIFGATATAAVTPALTRVSVDYSGEESETATGANFPRSFTVTVDVANGQTLGDVDITGALPNNVAFLGASTSVGGTVIGQPAVGVASNGSAVVANFASIVGTGSASDATLTVNYFVPELDANGAAVIDPVTADDSSSIGIDVSLQGDFTPADGRDTASTDNVNFDPAGTEASFTAKAITVVESVVIQNETGGAGATPGDTFEYTINIAVSDHFAFDNLSVTDLISDGQLFDNTFTPTLSLNLEGVAQGVVEFANANFSVTENKDNDPSTNVPGVNDGTSSIVFDLSQQIMDSGFDAGGALIGGAHPGGAAATGGTTGTITFRAVKQDIFTDAFPVGGDDHVNENDALDSNVTITGAVLDSALAPTGQSEADTSGTSTTVLDGNFTLDVFALNGVQQAVTTVQPGDDVTLRLTYNLTSGDFEDFTLTQFLSQPVFRSGDPDVNDPDYPATPDGPAFTQDLANAIPTVGKFAFGPSHSAVLNGNVPTITTNDVSNAVTFDFGTRQDDSNLPLTIDVLMTVRVSSDPFADGLLLTQQAEHIHRNTQQIATASAAIDSFTLAEPSLKITKGAVATDGSATFSSGVGPVTFAAPGDTGAPFSGTLSSGGLDTTPVDANISNIDGGDFVRMAIVVENEGSATNGAFDLSVRDLIPAGFEAVADNLKLQVRDGAGNVINFTDLGGGPIGDNGAGLFGAGLRLDDPGANQGSIGAFNASSGANIAVITYDLRAATTLESGRTVTADATLFNFAAVEGGPDFTVTDKTDAVTASAPAASVTSTIISSSEAHTTGLSSSAGNATIGEIVTVRTTITVPEGTSSTAKLVELLDPGLAVVGINSVTASAGLATDNPGGFVGVQAGAQVDNVSGAPIDQGRQLTLDFGTLTNTQNDGAAETIVVEYTAVVLNASETATPGTTLTTRGTFTSDETSVNETSDTITVVEPVVTVDNSVAPDSVDAGDTVTYTVVLTSGADADAFDVALSEAIPAGFTYVNGSVTNTAGFAPTTLGEAGGTISATFATLAKGQTSTITFQATADNNVAPNQTLDADANITWTTLSGSNTNISGNNTLSDERTGNPADEGGVLNDLAATDRATVTIQPLEPVLSIVQTSEAATTGNSDVAVGEIVRYRLEMKIAEGQASNLDLTARLPQGIQFLDDGTSRLNFVSTSGAAITSSDAGLNGAGVSGDENDVATVTPAFAVPGANIAPGAFGSGTDVTFSLGTVTNVENDANQEFLVIEFNARVMNVAAADNGALLGADATVSVGGNVVDTSNTQSVTVREPVLANLDKQVTSTDGTTATYTLTFSNTGNATAHDVRLLDTLEANLGNATVTSITPSGGASAGVDSSAGNTLDIAFDEVPVGGSVTVTFTAPLTDTTQVVANDTATLTYTSLDGTGTGLLTSVHGAAGTDTGERTGAGGVNDLIATDAVGLGTLSGTLFEDLLANQSLDVGEAPLANVRIDVVWAGNDGTLGNGDDVALTVTTDVAGNYNLGALPPGLFSFTVRNADIPAGFAAASDPQGAANDASAQITLGDAQALTGQDFRFLGANEAPAFTGLDATPDYTENGAAFVLDANATVADAELDLQGNYAGATLSIARNGGAQPQDVFANSGNLGSLTEGGNLTLNGTTIGTVTTNSGGTLVLTFNANATPAAVDEVLQSLTYENTSDDPQNSVQLDFALNDGNTGAQGSGGALAGSGSVTIAITPVNDEPTTTELGGDTLNYTEDDGAVLLDQGTPATLTDRDSANFDGGELRVSVAAGGVADEDVLAIRNQGTQAGEIGVDGANVTFGGVIIGTFTGGANGNDLVVLLNANATASAVEALLRNLSYENTDTTDPDTATRTVRVTVTDGDGGTSANADITVNVQDVNTAPTLTGLDNTPAFSENGAAQVIDGDAVLADEELDAFDNYNGATLTIARNGGAVGDDLFANTGNLGVLTQGGNLTLNGTPVGTVTTNAGGTLVLMFNANATSAVVDEVLQSITYANGSDAPPATVDLNVTLNDGNTAAVQGSGGALSASGTVTVNITRVNDAPAFTGLDNTPTHTEGGAPTVLDGDVDITDAELDAANNYAGASITLARNGGASADDVFSHTGNLGVLTEGGALVLNGTTVGTVTTNSGGTLVLTFNANATSAVVDEVLRSVAYSNGNDDPPANVQIDVTLNDGNTANAQGSGGAAAQVGSINVAITPTNDAPVSAGLDGDTLAYTEDDGPRVLDASGNVTLTDADSTDFAGGAVTVSVTAGGVAAEDSIAVRNQGTGPGQIGVDGNNITFGGVVIGTFTGGTNGNDFVLTLNADATPAAVQALLANLTYENTNTAGPSETPRNLQITVNDGDGGVSAAANVTVNVTTVNDPPNMTVVDDQSILVGTESFTAEVVLGDLESTSDTLTLTATSDDPDLLPPGSIVITGTGANRTVEITPAPGFVGTAQITLTLSDGTDTVTQTFFFTVAEPVEDDFFIPSDDGGDDGGADDGGADGGSSGAGGGGGGGAGGARVGFTGVDGGLPPILAPRTIAQRAAAALNLDLNLDGDLPDQLFDADEVRFDVPESAFRTTGENEIVEWQAKTTGGGALPPWLKFDPDTKSFTGVPPDLTETTVLNIVVQVRDDHGNEAQATFRLTIVPSEDAPNVTVPANSVGDGTDDGPDDGVGNGERRAAGADDSQQGTPPGADNAGQGGPQDGSDVDADAVDAGTPGLTEQLASTGTPAQQRETAGLLAALAA